MAGELAPPFTKQLAHIRQLGMGDPGWGQTQRWGLEGATPSVSFYDHEEGSENTNTSHSIRAGVNTAREQLPPSNPTTTRDARFSQFSSLPAARFFQGYWSNGFAWLAPEFNVVGNLVHTPLAKNWNPNQPGTKELFPATVYDPFPPGAALWPKAV
jgi:hypothetical protein